MTDQITTEASSIDGAASALNDGLGGNGIYGDRCDDLEDLQDTRAR